jgi:N-acetylglucosamine repressor
VWNVFNQRSLFIREPNEVRILRLVRDSGEISRIEISKKCDLNKAYVTELVAKLIKAGFLEETRKVEAAERVGRRRILLQFRPLAGLVAGVDVGMTHVRVALTDLNANILQQETFPYSEEATVKEIFSRVAATIHTLLEAANFSQSSLVGIGIGIQGLVDYSTNTLIFAQNRKAWQGESLSAELELRFSVPVYVENDVKAMTLGEYLLGTAKGTKNFVHIWVGDGLGAGFMINGHLYRGFTSSAGEIGYNGLDFSAYYKENFPYTFRDQSMFGEILTDHNFIESYRINSPHAHEGELTVAAIALKADNGDSIALHIIDEFVSLVSMLSINLVNTLNPEIIIIGGKLAQAYPACAAMLQERIHKDLLAAPAEAVRVKTAKHGEGGVILGAAGLVLYELFEPLHSTSLRAARRHKLIKEKAALTE